MSAPASWQAAADAENPEAQSCAEEGAWPREGLHLVVPGAPPATPAPVAVTPSWSHRFAGQLAWNVASEVAARGASLWLSFWCARALPVSTFGRFTFALALTQYLWLAGDATANGGFAAREIARLRGVAPDRAARLAGRFLSLRLGAGVALAALITGAALVIPMPGETRSALLGASVFFVAYAAFPDWALRAFEDFRGLAIGSVAAAAALVLSTLLWLPAHPSAGFAAALWGGSFGVAAVVALARLRLRGALSFARPHADDSRHWARSAIFSLGAIAGIGSAQAPLIAMGLLGEAHAGGLFGAAYRLVLAVLGVFTVLWWPLFPVLARSRPESPEFRDALAALSRTALLLALPATIAFLVWPREILSLAFGARYADGAAMLRLAALGIPIYALSGLLEQACLATGGEALRARAFGGAITLVALGSFTLVPALGAHGAAVLLGVAYGFTASVFAWRLHRRLPFPVMWREARPVLALAAGLAIAWSVAQRLGAPFLPVFAAGAMGYAAIAFGAGLFRSGSSRERSRA
ncbi:MAG: polysaccharide biosynthesis C-terminal domain-containing protein [Candidatus Eisenbacteria bacterium]|nr:polysaccharide biosynthesis C-terminal domain-containing protein [Candidatus Eisenbacteria bacterium]